jgi:hypothetical protein
VQQRHGRDKLEVVLLSVDPGYFGKDKSYLGSASKILKKQKVDWRCAFLPGGWSDTRQVFNLSGYGLVLVDAKGTVRGVNLRGEGLERAVADTVGKKQSGE